MHSHVFTVPVTSYTYTCRLCLSTVFQPQMLLPRKKKKKLHRWDRRSENWKQSDHRGVCKGFICRKFFPLAAVSICPSLSSFTDWSWVPTETLTPGYRNQDVANKAKQHAPKVWTSFLAHPIKRKDNTSKHNLPVNN